MNTTTPLFPLLTLLLLSSPAATAGESPAPSSPTSEGCADSVISFSPCLPYISAPPNDLSNEPSSQCCDIFNGAFDSDDAECLCYLVRQNSLLGFPLNLTRLMSLSDFCSVKNSSRASNSLDSICSGSPTLPPLIATPKKPPSGPNDRSSPPPPRHHPPMTKPAPVAYNASTRNSTNPSTSKQSGNHRDLEFTSIWRFLSGLVYFIIAQNIAGMED